MKTFKRTHSQPAAMRLQRIGVAALGAAALSLLGLHPAQAQVTLTAADGFGASSFNTGLHWSNGQAPSAANDYVVGTLNGTSGLTLRTPSDGTTNLTFGGKSLTIGNSTAFLIYKGPGGDTLTVNNLTLSNGGGINNGAGGSFTLAGTNMTLGTGGGLFETQGGGRGIIVSAAVGGAGSLTASNNIGSGGGAGTVTLTGANIYTGGTILAAASTAAGNSLTLQIGNGGMTGTLGTGNVTTNTNTILSFDLSNNYSVSNIISGVGSLTQIGTGATILTGADTYSGATTISGGTLQLGNGTSGSDGSVTTSGITDNANLTYNLFGPQTAGYVISGTGSLTKAGAGTLTLTKADTYTGATTISGGTLAVGSTGSLTTSNVTVASGATFDTNGSVLLGGNTLNMSGAGSVVNIGGGTFTFATGNSNPDGNYQGTFTQTGGTVMTDEFDESGATAENTTYYLGGGSFAAGSGQYGSLNTGERGLGSFYVSGTGALTVTGDTNPNNSDFQQLVVGGVFNNGSGLQSGTRTFVQQGGTVTANGLDIGSLQASNVGTAANVNTYYLNKGTLTTSALTTTANGTNSLVFGGGTFENGAAFTTAGPATYINSGGAIIDTTNGNLTWSGVIGAGTTGNVVAPVLTAPTGSGYTSAPTVAITGGGGTGATAVAEINQAGQVVDVVVTNPGSGYTTAPTFTFTGGGGGTGAAVTGTIATGNGGLTKNGVNTLTLAGANTYTGATTISGGTLQLGNGTANGTLGTGPVADNAALTFSSTAAGNIVSNVISGNGTVTQSAGLTTLSGANTYTGATTITGGTLAISKTNSLGTGTVTLNGGALDLGFGTNFAYNQALTLTADSTLGLTSGNGQVNDNGTITGNSHALTINNNGSGSALYLNDTISNVSQINVASGALGFTFGSGNQGGGAAVNVSSGATLQTYNSGTDTSNLTLNGGALYNQGGGAATFSGTVALASSSTINTGGGNITISGPVSGSGALTKISNNTLTLSSTNDTYSGGTTITGGTLALNSAKADGTGPLSVGSGTVVQTGVTNALGSGNTTLTAGTIQNTDLTANDPNTASHPGTSNDKQSTGTLTLGNGASILDFGAGNTGAIFSFAGSSLASWTGTLSVYDYNGLPPTSYNPATQVGTTGGGGLDQLFFGTDSTGLTQAQLNDITFYSGAGTGKYAGPAIILADGEVAAAPEPSAWAGLGFTAFGLGGLLLRARKRKDADANNAEAAV